MLAPTVRSSFKVLTFNGEGEVKLFLEQLEDVTATNESTDKDDLVHLKSSIQGPAQTNERGSTIQENVEFLCMS